MSGAPPENPSVVPHAANESAAAISKSDEKTIDEVSQPGDNQFANLQEDPNPRTPKRRRLSAEINDVEINFEQAAARALAISLGVDQPDLSVAPRIPVGQQNGAGEDTSQQTFGQSQSFSPDQQARIDGLAKLDDLATQLLSTLAGMSHLEIGEMLFGPASQRGQDYGALKSKFDQAKRPYLTNSPFISPTALCIKDGDQVDVLRKTNMATFMASIFSGEIGLRIMDINFLDVFVPEGGRLLKAQASIYLELKTQAFIAAKRTMPAMLDSAMLELFPDDAEIYLLAKRPGAKSLLPSETDFLKRLASRRDILYSNMRDNKLDGLQFKYRWDDFSREVNSYLVKNYDQSGSGSKEKGDQASPNPTHAQLPQNQMESQFPVVSNHNQQLDPVPSTAMNRFDLDFDMDDFVAKAARAAEIALQGTEHAGYGPVRTESSVSGPTPVMLPPADTSAPFPLQPAVEAQQKPNTLNTPPISRDEQDKHKIVMTEFQQYKPAVAEASSTTVSASEDSKDGVPHKSQTAPTQVLYERARLVTTNKSLSSRKAVPPSHRRPWTNEEENALMTGLDQVKGPHWSQILAMYGPGGTINESLKDRNQVQLKDKARNLKLFFLKAGIEVPYYLQAVTGDLKTRAPGQAEKQEAKERERTKIEEDETAVQQDEGVLGNIDGLDLPNQSVSDQEDNPDSTPAAYQEAAERSQETDGNVEMSAGDVFDMEAMIARAAASAEQSWGGTWP